MKSLLLSVILTIPALLVNGQAKEFKTKSKNPSGTASPSINFIQAGNQNMLKSTQSSGYVASSVALSFPGFNGTDKPRVIRKGNSPVYIEVGVSPLKSATAATPEDRFFSFMEETKSITKIESPRESFKISKIDTDNLGITHIKANQQFKGIEIYGSESILHLDTRKERFTGSLHKVRADVPTTAKIAGPKALQNTLADLKQITNYRELSVSEKKLLHYDAPEYSLVLYDRGEQNYALAWAITVRPNVIEQWKYFIDAGSGEIIRKYNNTNSDGPATANATDLNNVSRTIDTYLEGSNYLLVNTTEAMYNATSQEGAIITFDANNTSTDDFDYSFVTSTTNTWTDKSSVSAHYNATRAYEYFKNTFDRNSINGQGGTIMSFINLAEVDGTSMENAFWNGEAIFYGNGGDFFKPLAGGLDVAAHEMAHGVVGNSANLEYYGQSGAMNESFADIFGAMVDRDDWKLGEDVTRLTYSPSGALRDMADPHNSGDNNDQYWQPKHVSEMYIGTSDNGGVHINSGISNHAFYLFATEVTKEVAEQVYYRALTEYLTKTSQFIDLRIAVVQSAVDIHGAGSAVVTAAEEAFDAVGIREEDPVDDDPDYDPNPGEEHLLIYNTDPEFPQTLWVSPVSGNEYLPLSSTTMKGKVSVSDDGSLAVFVTDDSKIKYLSTNPDNPQEDFLSDEAFFDNVAISKDGNRLAAISTEVDTSIYLYDFVGMEWYKFKLYNPTTSESNSNFGGVLYADAIEFDITGQYLIYDAYNELNSSTFEDISYWDVGFIKVWDNNTDAAGDGSISKLFTSLPQNVSVGNPVFSKNSPYIIAFDYFFDDGVAQEYGIYGANLETGDLELITENSTLGYPSYSKSDGKIAFSTVVATGTGFTENVNTIPLSTDKITPSGTATLLITASKWPVYFATGDRTLGLAPVANFTSDYSSGNATFQVKFVDLSANDPTSWVWTFQGGTPASSTQQNPQVSYATPGTYKVTLKATNDYGSNTLPREGYIVVLNPTGVNDPEMNPLVFYPNPVIDFLTINYEGDFTVKLFNAQGELLLTGENDNRLDLSKLKSGIYLLELETKEGISQHKLLKQ